MLETLEECFPTERKLLTEKAETFGRFLERKGNTSKIVCFGGIRVYIASRYLPSTLQTSQTLRVAIALASQARQHSEFYLTRKRRERKDARASLVLAYGTLTLGKADSAGEATRQFCVLRGSA